MASIDLIRASNGSGDAVKATVTNARVISSTTLQVDATTNWPSKFIATVGDVDGTGAFVPATVTVFNGILSGGNIEITSFAPGYTDLGNAPGQIVVLKPTTAWANEVASTLGVAHNDNGTLKSPVGINKVPTQGALDVDGDIYSNGVKVSTYQPSDYSTSEQNTGQKWIDGKTIYRKTFNLGAYPNNTTKNVAHGIAGLETVIKTEGSSYGSGLIYDTIGQFYDASRARIYFTSTNIVMQSSFNATSLNAVMTMYYTKT